MNLEPGPDLDALVAEHVLGWTHVRPGIEAAFPPEGDESPFQLRAIPAYSRDVRHAVDVLEATGERLGRGFTLRRSGPASSFAWLAHVDQEPNGHAGATAAHAICLAALAAVRRTP